MTYGPYCTYCLATRDARVPVAALLPNGGKLAYPHAPTARGLAVWAVSIQSTNPDATFQIGDRPDALLPVGTWHGDYVCETHLMELVP
jgi:hypothetical protein